MNTVVEIHGLKCDNPKCDYRDDTVKYEDYEKYIGAKCPKCGMVLLTQKEYDMCKFLVDASKLASEIFKDDEDMVSVKIDIVDQDRFEED
ncbi:MAG: hypothetical protein SOV85_01840 [Clostridium sp.]|uniref:hypothetical protein n=1 Tax=Clostridium sp. TaxID=1506 RepID=UPI002A749B69|nr:hypothetical protein [Clostridium sp.]MDY2630085.1 hypothetical protein [Clostridium sp.]